MCSSFLITGAALVPYGPFLYAAEDSLDIRIEKKGLGKEVTIRQGSREWFMMVEVTPENTVIVRQEKNNEAYVLDESENHDRALTSGEVDAAIADFVNSVKAQTKQK
jgi:ABC-type amino acid transport substrate-binding protein